MSKANNSDLVKLNITMSDSIFEFDENFGKNAHKKNLQAVVTFHQSRIQEAYLHQISSRIAHLMHSVNGIESKLKR